jgi:hypothetical protein
MPGSFGVQSQTEASICGDKLPVVLANDFLDPEDYFCASAHEMRENLLRPIKTNL